jgi:ATP phosphoribosyltransferase regulatory subunit HisZ
MPAPDPNHELPSSMLRALGELHVAALRLEVLVDGTPEEGSDLTVFHVWRRIGSADLEEARRMAQAAADAAVVSGELLVESIDGSRVLVGPPGVRKLADRLAKAVRAGRALGVAPRRRPR